MLTRVEEKQEKRNWETYIHLVYPNMTEQTFKSYEDFYKSREPQKLSKEKTEDLLKRAEVIRKNAAKGGS